MVVGKRERGGVMFAVEQCNPGARRRLFGRYPYPSTAASSVLVQTIHYHGDSQHLSILVLVVILGPFLVLNSDNDSLGAWDPSIRE